MYCPIADEGGNWDYQWLAPSVLCHLFFNPCLNDEELHAEEGV